MGEHPELLYAESIESPRWYTGGIGLIAALLVFGGGNGFGSGWPGLVSMGLAIGAALWFFWLARLMSAAYVRVQPGQLFLGKGRERMMQRWVRHGDPSYVGGHSYGALAASFRPEAITVSRRDLWPGTGYQLPPFRYWFFGMKEYHVPMVRTGVTIEAPGLGTFFASSRDPEALMEAIAAAQQGVPRSDSHGGGE